MCEGSSPGGSFVHDVIPHGRRASRLVKYKSLISVANSSISPMDTVESLEGPSEAQPRPDCEGGRVHNILRHVRCLGV